MQQLPLSQVKSFKATVVRCSLCGRGSRLLTYTSVFPQKTTGGMLGSCFAPPSGVATSVSKLHLISLRVCCQRRLLEASLLFKLRALSLSGSDVYIPVKFLASVLEHLTSTSKFILPSTGSTPCAPKSHCESSQCLVRREF